MMPTLSPSTCARFQLTAARRRLVGTFAPGDNGELFQLTAARRRLAFWDKLNQMLQKFQLTAARRRLAGLIGRLTMLKKCFNSQPPEGGWT